MLQQIRYSTPICRTHAPALPSARYRSVYGTSDYWETHSLEAEQKRRKIGQKGACLNRVTFDCKLLSRQAAIYRLVWRVCKI